MKLGSQQIAIVGGGIAGLAHALACARRGHQVTVFERGARAQEASVRNFGMIWPVGQPPELYRLARRSREIWQEVAAEAGIWWDPCGSLHLAHRDDEEQVLREFIEHQGDHQQQIGWLDAGQTMSLSPAVRAQGLRGAMHSPHEACIDPREALARLPGWLHQRHGVQFHFATAVTAVDTGQLTAGGTRHRFDRIIVCPGADFETLFPDWFAGSGVTRCKLQMMRTVPQPNGWRMGPMLAAGLTLRHYGAFRDCPSLPALRQRVARETPEFDRWGIHVMASQNGLGELVIGDSHEYGLEVSPFNRTGIDRLILNYLHGFLQAPDLTIASRWHGVYPRHPEHPVLTGEPRPGVHLVGALGGAGMTLGFGLAEQQVDTWLANPQAAACSDPNESPSFNESSRPASAAPMA